ncbi:hypothetical protein ABSA28_00819 [Candidatus Hepatincolaceae symbiont of Richtersius coronifer]
MYSVRKNEDIKSYLLLLPVLVIRELITKHFIPVFNNLLVLKNYQFTADAISFTFYLNINKALVDILLGALILKLPPTKNDWINIVKEIKNKIPLIIITLILLSYFFSYVKFSPKLTDHLLICRISNLLNTCFVEEVLFRGVLKNHLS